MANKKQKPKQNEKPKQSWKSFLVHGKKPGTSSVFRDWMLVLLVVLVAVSSFLTIGGMMFWNTFFEDGSLETEDAAQNGVVVDSMELETVISQYEEKENTFRALKQNPPNVVDPSE